MRPHSATNRVRCHIDLMVRRLECTVTDCKLPNPASFISLGPEDTFLRVITRQSNTASTPQWREVVGVAVHRRYGIWTHIYSCLFTSTGRPVVHLVRVVQGEFLTEAVDWIAARSISPGILFARPPRSPAIRNGPIDAGARHQQLGPATRTLRGVGVGNDVELPTMLAEGVPHGALRPDPFRICTQRRAARSPAPAPPLARRADQGATPPPSINRQLDPTPSG